MQIVHALIGLWIQRIQPGDEVFTELQQCFPAFLEAVGRLAHSAADTEYPVDLNEADLPAQAGTAGVGFPHLQTAVNQLLRIAHGLPGVLGVERIVEPAAQMLIQLGGAFVHLSGVAQTVLGIGMIPDPLEVGSLPVQIHLTGQN